jgi:hypothetical protein
MPVVLVSRDHQHAASFDRIIHDHAQLPQRLDRNESRRRWVSVHLGQRRGEMQDNAPAATRLC